MAKRPPLPERFWSKVTIRTPEDCWEWRANRNPGGYGQFWGRCRVTGKCRTFMAHRVAYELTSGPIPDGLHIDHLCRNTGCVNPAHLEAVTAAENNKRAGAAKNACKRGHPFTPDNIGRGNRGTRVCKTCCRAKQRRWREKQKLTKAA